MSIVAFDRCPSDGQIVEEVGLCLPKLMMIICSKLKRRETRFRVF